MNLIKRMKEASVKATELDVFNLPCVKSIHIHYFPPRNAVKNMFIGECRQKETAAATVKFNKGDTSGERAFNGKNIPDVMKQIERFLRSLDGQD